MYLKSQEAKQSKSTEVIEVETRQKAEAHLDTYEQKQQEFENIWKNSQ